MADSYAVPTVLLLTVVTAIFAVLYRRQRQVATLLVFLAWVAVVLRVLVESFGAGLGPWAHIASDCDLVTASLLFVTAYSPDTFGRRHPVLYGVVLAVPLNAFVIAAEAAGETRAGYLTACLLFALCVVWSFLWADANRLYPKRVNYPLTAVFSIGCSYFLYQHNFDLAITLVLAGMFYLAGFGFGFRSARRSPGSVLVVAGLAGWATVFAAYLFSSHSAQVAQKLTQVSDLLKIITAIGMMISLLEDETRIAAEARRREEQLRDELDRYTAIDLTPIPGLAQDEVFGHVCAMVAAHSPFAQCALLLRTAAGVSLACAEGVPEDQLPAIQQAAHHSAGATALQGPEPPLSLAGLVPLRVPDLQSPDTELVTGYLLPLLSQAASVHGWLWLAALRGPAESFERRLLLPLESLASRLSIALENRELTQRLIRTDRLAGLGKLAGGVAHELNNPLTIVQGYAELIADATDESATAKQARIILNEADRMKRIISDMNQFWRTSSVEFAEVNVASLLLSIENMFRRDLLRRNVVLSVHIAENLPAVHGSQNSLRQVLVQVLNNAVESIEKRGDEPPNQNERRVRIDASHSDGKVHIMISDSGPGFDDPDRAFDPFYTTKDPREGTGLGLSVCYGLVRQHRGEISAINLQPNGAAVVIDLPVPSAMSELQDEAVDEAVGSRE